ncbi:MAG: glycosyltransferase [Lachnospiraceae bacterium]|nr:glycosyltransferase [Lachnospiraceae bacterium]
MKKVNIILCTYNGSRYLREQIESLLNQTYDHIDIYIYDDKSTDNTMEIIKEYMEQKHCGKRMYLIELPEKLGYPQCFIQALLASERADYYAFCDQDDIWMPDKIEKGVKALDELEGAAQTAPKLYFSSVAYCDEDMNFLRYSRFSEHLKKASGLVGLQELMFGGDALGMTYLFNHVVREELLATYERGYTKMKDGFIKLYAASVGAVYYEKQPTAKYRRHGGATTNNLNPKGKLERYKSMIQGMFFKRNAFELFREMVSYIQQYHMSEIKDLDNRKLISLFASTDSLKRRITKVFWKKRFRVVWIDEIGYRILFLIGRV